MQLRKQAAPRAAENWKDKEAMVKRTIAGMDVVKQKSLHKTNIVKPEMLDAKAC